MQVKFKFHFEAFAFDGYICESATKINDIFM